MQHLPTFASSIHSLFNPIEIMKLKQIFMLLGAVVLKFIDDTKFTSQSTQQTIKNGAVVDTEVDDPEQGTYTYQGGVATLLFNTRDDEDNAIKLALPLTMDSSKQQLTGKAPESGTILTFVRKK